MGLRRVKVIEFSMSERGLHGTRSALGSERSSRGSIPGRTSGENIKEIGYCQDI